MVIENDGFWIIILVDKQWILFFAWCKWTGVMKNKEITSKCHSGHQLLKPEIFINSRLIPYLHCWYSISSFWLSYQTWCYWFTTCCRSRREWFWTILCGRCFWYLISVMQSYTCSHNLKWRRKSATNLLMWGLCMEELIETPMNHVT